MSRSVLTVADDFNSPNVYIRQLIVTSINHYLIVYTIEVIWYCAMEIWPPLCEI